MNSSISTIAHHLIDQSESIFNWFIVISYVFCVPAAILNFLFLVSSARYWKIFRNKAKSISDVNNYKNASCHYVKYSLSAVVILLEILIILLFAFVLLFMNISSQFSRDHIYRYITEKIASCLTSFAFVILITVLCVLNMLCRFLTTVLARSELDMDVLTRMSWKCFWKCIISFTLSTVGFEIINVFGDLLTSILLISECFYLLKGSKRLYRALKSKRIDYFYHRKHRNFFQKQILSFKWGAVVIIILSFFIVTHGCLVFYESAMTITKRIFAERNQSFDSISHGEYELVHLVCFISMRVASNMWASISTLLNYILAIKFVVNAIKYRHSISKPYHYKPKFLNFSRVKAYDAEKANK